MKFLKISEEIEKHLVTIFDAALKAGGMQVHHQVHAVISSIQLPPEEIKEPPAQ